MFGPKKKSCHVHYVPLFTTLGGYLAATCLMLARTSQILQCVESRFPHMTHAVLLQLVTKVVAVQITLV